MGTYLFFLQKKLLRAQLSWNYVCVISILAHLFQRNKYLNLVLEDSQYFDLLFGRTNAVFKNSKKAKVLKKFFRRNSRANSQSQWWQGKSSRAAQCRASIGEIYVAVEQKLIEIKIQTWCREMDHKNNPIYIAVEHPPIYVSVENVSSCFILIKCMQQYQL